MYLSAVELSEAIRNNKLSCVELMEWTLDRIDALNPSHNAIVSLQDHKSLLGEAKTADEALKRGEYRGWLHGMPHAVKDLANLKGFNTSMGSPIFKDTVADEDDICIERIRNAGAIFIGKTNVPEFGLGSQSYNPVFGTTGNAFDASLTAGGSSGGAAVGLALGLLPVADGSDMMGSLRNPAAFNNVVGFRPSFGRIPKAAPELFLNQLATEGPMGRTVTDVIHLFTTMAGASRRAPQSHYPALPNPTEFSAATISDLKVGWLKDFDQYLPMEAGVIDTCEMALNQFESGGGNVEQTNIKFDMPRLWDSWLKQRQWALRKYHPLYANEAQRAQLKPELVWEIEQGFNLSVSELDESIATRSSWFRKLNKVFESFDILALPSAQMFPFSVETHWPNEVGGQSMDTYHRWMEVVIGASLAGCPVISLPAGFDQTGKRAMGIQFMAPVGEDQKLLEFALAYEQQVPWHKAYGFSK